MNFIYHITTRKTYELAQQEGLYTYCSLNTEGFIHCSTREQYLKVANNFFKDQADLVLLKIQLVQLISKLVYENTEGGDELFPHLYGPMNLDAIVEVYNLTQKDGQFIEAF